MDYWTLMTLYDTICHFLYVPSGCITHMEIAKEAELYKSAWEITSVK